MYLRVEIRSDEEMQEFITLPIASCYRGPTEATVMLDGGATLALHDMTNFPEAEGAIGVLSIPDQDHVYAYSIQPMTSIDNEIRSIMSEFFETPPDQPQPTPELPLPPMMGFDDDGE